MPQSCRAVCENTWQEFYQKCEKNVLICDC